MAREVRRWEASDGSLHMDMEAAEQVDKREDFKDAVGQYIAHAEFDVDGFIDRVLSDEAFARKAGGIFEWLHKPEDPDDPETQEDYPYLEFSKMTHHFCKVEISGDTLNCAAVDPNGVVFDSFVIQH